MFLLQLQPEELLYLSRFPFFLFFFFFLVQTLKSQSEQDRILCLLFLNDRARSEILRALSKRRVDGYWSMYFARLALSLERKGIKGKKGKNLLEIAET